MFGRRLPLVRLLGFEIRFDLTWLILLALIVWTLSAGYFPASYRDLSAGTYFWMGILGAIGLVASIVVHELAHSVVARRFGMQIHGITLFAFGGAAEMAEEPPTPAAEFWMAIAGPVTSLVVAALFYGLGLAFEAVAAPGALTAVIAYLAGINVILALFNLVPAFPLDGGRVLRAILWGWRRDLRWATRIAAGIGGGFGLGLIVFGVLNALMGNVVGGLWMFLIGLFLRAAAGGSYQQLVARDVLSGAPVARFMSRDPVTAPAGARVAELVEDYFLGRYLKAVPVVDDGRVVGIVDVRAAKAVPREAWHERRIAEIMTPLSAENTIASNADATSALDVMRRTGNGRLLVMEGNRLLGIVSLKDMLRVLSLRLDFEDALPASDGRTRQDLTHRPI
ncbi:MAG TPA: site-2 protease family protein [Alphaproteobacteria bacterium]